MELTRQQVAELSEFYWDTDVSTKELQDYFGLPRAVHRYINPLAAGEECPNCSAVLVYPSRSARDRGEKECRACGHASRGGGWSYGCACDYCGVARAEEERRRSEEALRLAIERYDEHKERVSTSKHVQWAISKLTRRQKLFLRSFIQVVEESEHPTWEDICDRAGVVSERSYVTKLVQLGLLLDRPNGGIFANPVLTIEMIGLEEEVRKISNALRFEVFQRDRHTCQYCGRRAPDVELELDHLIPVARGGTDAFENLITSCRECNSGKSAKLIERFTHGHMKESWREKIREKRIESLEEKRSELEDVLDYWAECRGMDAVTGYDEEAIFRFVETYDPAWIKAAIRIATRQRRSNYVKYVSGILKNWAKPVRRNSWPTQTRLSPTPWSRRRQRTNRSLSRHRKRGRCQHIRFHRLGETEERVERFVLGLLHDPGTLRAKVEEQADRERSALRNAGREVRRIRSRLDKLEIMEDNYHDQQAEGLISMDRLRSKLASLSEERADLERRVAELSHSEERLRELEVLPQMVEEYLRDLPHLLELEPVVREYETSAPEPTEGDPLSALYTITPDRIRFLPEEELAEKRRAVEEKRARRFRELYAMLNLNVVCHKDRSLEVSWGTHCHEWLGRG